MLFICCLLVNVDKFVLQLTFTTIKEINSMNHNLTGTIKETLNTCQPLVAPQNWSPTRTRNPIYQPHKTFDLRYQGVQSFGI